MAKGSLLAELPLLLFGGAVVFGFMGRGPELLLSSWAAKRSMTEPRVDAAALMGQVIQVGVTLGGGGLLLGLPMAACGAAFVMLSSLVVAVRRRQRREGLNGALGDTFGMLHGGLLAALVFVGQVQQSRS